MGWSCFAELKVKSGIFINELSLYFIGAVKYFLSVSNVLGIGAQVCKREVAFFSFPLMGVKFDMSWLCLF